MISPAVILGTVLASILYLYFKYVKPRLSILNQLKKLPGPPNKNAVVGNIIPLIDTPRNIFKITRGWARDYYPIYQISGFHVGGANILTPEDFELVLTNMKHNTKSDIYNFLHSWLGTGLLTSTGSKWQQRRKILTPAFHFNILQEFIKVFHNETKNLVEVFKKECHKPYIAVTDHISGFALDTIGETAMGTGFVSNTVNVKDYKSAIYQLGHIVVYKMCRPWLALDLIYKLMPTARKEKQLLDTLHRFTNEVISKRDTNFEVSYSRKKRLAMLDLLLTAKKQEGIIDDDGIREEVDTFMFEGHDTTSVAMGFALMLLANHREVQDLIYEEIQSVLTDSTPDYNTLQELKYMDRCIKEVLRLYPSVPFIGRQLGEDLVTHSGYYLKAGTLVHGHIYDLHRDPRIYPDPEKFNPDRFLPENCKNRHPFAYIPFSAGSRNCIGQKFAMLEVKAVLCGILREFILEPVDTPDTVALIADLVIRTEDSIKVKFVPRKGM